ncbi:DUF3857 domain-containing transglutaminase family protein [Aliiroseovarius marinus]|uniref:DUF3857 domain-containing transglutaminase family protein n=1 Tax=Aliiroseovarius marinus TaxID=2500159 RepID=UPI002495397B|nr:DUF3857 domain-containing protein [Aliiroseovarius marinus]
MYLRFLAVFAFILTSLSAQAQAQNVDQYVSVTPPEDWVVHHEPASGSFGLAKDEDRIYRLIDKQMLASDTEEKFFYRDVTSLMSADAVDDYGSIIIAFNPAYETIALHHVRIIRATGEVVDVTQQGEMQLYRRESDREQRIYDGSLELAFLVPQLKQGDTLDYAYTAHGRNPALGPHWQYRFSHNYSRPTQRMRDRLLVATGTPAFLKAHGGAPEPTITQLGDFTEYAWAAENVPGQSVEDGIPKGYRAWTSTTTSSVEFWSDIGRFFAPHYDPAQYQNTQVVGIANTIRTAHPNAPKAQLRAALAYVQKEVRYTAVQLGVGGFIPRDPARVLRRGFGDCKDMTVLLISILYALDIDATPLLVNTEYGAGLNDDIPRIRAFDHVVVRASVGERNYVLDPTRGEQLGNLDHLQQGLFGKGVIIAPDSVGMITTYVRQPEYYNDVVDTFDLRTDPDAILFTSKATYVGSEADGMLNWANSVGKAEIEKTFFDYFKGIYPSIEITNPLELVIDKTRAKLTVITHYRLPDEWEDDTETGGQVFWASPEDLLSKLPKLEDDTRTAPFAIAHPIRFRHQLKYLVDPSWGYDNKTDFFNSAAFDLKLAVRGKPGTTTWTYSYVTKSDRILSKTWKDARQALKGLDDTRWVRLDRPGEGALVTRIGLDSLSEDDWVAVVVAYMVVVVLAMLIYVSYRAPPTEAEMKLQILYPVSTAKFLIMSVGTLGVYSLYWFWQNWRWLRDVENQNVSPFWRGLGLAALWNFSLFRRIATQAPEARPALSRLAYPLAGLYLVFSIISQVLDGEDSPLVLTVLFAILPVLVALPFQREVLRKNVENQKWVARNSRFGWQAIVTLLLWLPILFLMGVGMGLAE